MKKGEVKELIFQNNLLGNAIVIGVAYYLYLNGWMVVRVLF